MAALYLGARDRRIARDEILAHECECVRRTPAEIDCSPSRRHQSSAGLRHSPPLDDGDRVGHPPNLQLAAVRLGAVVPMGATNRESLRIRREARDLFGYDEDSSRRVHEMIGGFTLVPVPFDNMKAVRRDAAHVTVSLVVLGARLVDETAFYSGPEPHKECVADATCRPA